MERHFNVTVYVLNPKNLRFLMIKHKKLGAYLPPGGHIDPNEIPDVAALREVSEETGIETTLYGDTFPNGAGLVRPFGIQRNIIEAGKHEHLDIIYLATPKGEAELRVNNRETDGAEWYSIEEIQEESFNSFPATKQWCRYFHDMFQKR